MDVVLYGRYNDSMALVSVCCCLCCRWKCWLLIIAMALHRLGEALSPHGWAFDFSDAAILAVSECWKPCLYRASLLAYCRLIA